MSNGNTATIAATRKTAAEARLIACLDELESRWEYEELMFLKHGVGWGRNGEDKRVATAAAHLAGEAMGFPAPRQNKSGIAVEAKEKDGKPGGQGEGA